MRQTQIALIVHPNKTIVAVPWLIKPSEPTHSGYIDEENEIMTRYRARWNIYESRLKTAFECDQTIAQKILNERYLDRKVNLHFPKHYDVYGVTLRDTALLKPFAQEQGTLYKARKKPKLFSFTGSSIYYNRYVASAHRKKVTIINRVIGATQKTHTHELHMRQVKALYPRTLRSVDFAIAPKGVMFMHTSLAINNPILWMSHAEFQARLITESHKSGFSILKFAQDNICRNAVLYKMEHMDCK